ncbi:MAG: DUF948 domain-containing protein [Streptosporangiales bacterium]|nr:DUF948 domain-containing protein [Streptosporangiales bacterium]
MLTWAQFAGLVAAFAWAVLVGFLAYVLIKLARVLDQTTKLLASVEERTAPLLDEMATTVARTNDQLDRVDLITRNVQSVTDNVTGLTGLVTSAVGRPIVRVAAFGYGLRRAIGGGRRAEVQPRVRGEIKAERRGRRKDAA